MQVQIVLVHIYMATTITFVINIVMKGKSPPSIMCTTTTNDIYYELKHDNDIIIMKMLHKRKCTSPNKPYFTPSPNFMTQEKTARRAPPRRSYGYNHHFGIFAKCSQGIFAFGRTASSPTSHEYTYFDIIKSKAATYMQG